MSAGRLSSLVSTGVTGGRPEGRFGLLDLPPEAGLYNGSRAGGNRLGVGIALSVKDCTEIVEGKPHYPVEVSATAAVVLEGGSVGDLDLHGF